MANYRFTILPALLALVAFLVTANLIFSVSARGQTPRPPKVATYMLQVRGGLSNGATFTAAPGYKLVSVFPCAGASGPYGQGAYLCLIEKRGDEH
jgi:hypothetical protein